MIALLCVFCAMVDNQLEGPQVREAVAIEDGASVCDLHTCASAVEPSATTGDRATCAQCRTSGGQHAAWFFLGGTPLCIRHAASGYSTALLAELVGPGGRVTSLDIDPEMTGRTARLIALHGIGNVSLDCCDGRAGHSAAAPFGRLVA